MAVAAIDWLALTVVTASLLLGAWRGLLYEVLALAGWVLAFLAARWAAPLVGQWLPMGESPEPLRHAVGFALVFIATAFACGLLAALARRASRALGVRPVQRRIEPSAVAQRDPHAPLEVDGRHFFSGRSAAGRQQQGQAQQDMSQSHRGSPLDVPIPAGSVSLVVRTGRIGPVRGMDSLCCRGANAVRPAASAFAGRHP